MRYLGTTLVTVLYVIIIVGDHYAIIPPQLKRGSLLREDAGQIGNISMRRICSSIGDAR